MKAKLLAFALISSLFLSSTVTHAATLAVHSSGSLKQKDYLCIYNMGCINLKIASSGKTFKSAEINFTQLKRMAILNSSTHEISSTAIDSSCSRIVAGVNQTVTVNVKVGTDRKTSASVIKNVSCALSG